jgi:hypothetical protein
VPRRSRREPAEWQRTPDCGDQAGRETTLASLLTTRSAPRPLHSAAIERQKRRLEEPPGAAAGMPEVTIAQAATTSAGGTTAA